MVTGWPLRSGRPSYGPIMQDERLTVDTRQEVNASQINLSFWQTGAMGLCAPKAVMYFADNEGLDLVYGLFSWDNVIYDFETPSYFTFTFNNAGNYTVQFDNQVLGRPDEDGIQQLEVLDFQFGLGSVNNINQTQRVFLEFDLVDSQTFNILTPRGDGTLVEEPFALAVW